MILQKRGIGQMIDSDLPELWTALFSFFIVIQSITEDGQWDKWVKEKTEASLKKFWWMWQLRSLQ